MKALLLENIHPSAVARLEAAGVEVDLRKAAMSEDELVHALPGVDLLGIRSNTTITDRVLEAAPDLLAVGCFCIGTNQVDLAAAARRTVAVFNAPYSNTRSVVELVIGEIIVLARRLVEKTIRMHDGIWDKSAAGSHEIRGRTLGIVGYGNIGSQLSVVAEAVGLRVIFYDVTDRLAHGNARRMGSLEELLAEADVGLAARRRPARQRRLLRRRALRRDEAALAVHQRRPRHGRRHRGAARADPLRPHRRRRARRLPDRAEGAGRPVRVPAARPRQRHPHPARRRLHPGGAGGDRALRRRQARLLRPRGQHRALGQPADRPGPAAAGGYRLAHLHESVPGVLAEINRVLAEAEANVLAQSLATRGEQGYVVTDIAAPLSRRRADRLRAMPHTLRMRHLTGLTRPPRPSSARPGTPDALGPPGTMDG